ncbi:MAG: cellulase family glycosylhydrolase [Planctomycetota bacterium]|nr:cellulase family glycosylhydrolase [Planctomycetota bacterium]
MANTVPCFGRWEKLFDAQLKIDRVEFTGPDGKTETRPAFLHQPAEFSYDRHGYESLKPKGPPVTAVRFTPAKAGKYRYRALGGQNAAEEGELVCEASSHPGYVIVSARDSRYFALTGGASFCPIGVNLCWPETFALPSGKEFGASGARGTLGCGQYKRWLAELSRNGGNFIRIWAANGYFEAQTETAGKMDDLMFNKLDRVIELARENNVRVKLCMDYFRSFRSGAPMRRTLKHPDDGRSPKDMNEFFREKTWRDLWLKKLRAYEARYGGDPAVAVIELWNEINACEGDWEAKRDWTRDMLRELKPMFPRQLVVNSLGSYDSDWAKQHHVDFKMDEMPFQQVHRYLDQGAAYKICSDPVAFSIDATNVARRPDRPILLAETGGVNDNHTGPFRFYAADHRGIIFHDTTFPAFFAGAAGTGQIWHWDCYVDQKNLWPAFKPFADMLAGVQLDQEDFKPADLSNDKAWCLVLRGKKHVLVWARNKADRWDLVLRDGQEPPLLKNMSFDLAPLGLKGGTLTVSSQWPEMLTGAKLDAGQLSLPPFRYGLMAKIVLE